jgi:hypothetical protein
LGAKEVSDKLDRQKVKTWSRNDKQIGIKSSAHEPIGGKKCSKEFSRKLSSSMFALEPARN